jgi:hypothetical protein
VEFGNIATDWYHILVVIDMTSFREFGDNAGVEEETFNQKGSGVRVLQQKLTDISHFSNELFFASPAGAVRKRYKSADRFISLALQNMVNLEILRRLPSHGLPNWWLTSGCLFQSVWNVLLGRNPQDGILDYDIFYYDTDLSWTAEDRAIQAVNSLFSDLEVNIQVRNQARVHLWYEEKFGIPYPRLRDSRHAIRRFPSKAAAVAVKTTKDGDILFYAPFGFRGALTMSIKPNTWLDIPDVYKKKTSRWSTEWKMLRVFPWPNERHAGETPKWAKIGKPEVYQGQLFSLDPVA